MFHQIVKNDTPVYLALDPDAKRKTDKIIKLLLKYDVQICDVKIEPHKDAGGMSKEEFSTRKHSAEVLNLDNMALMLLYKSYKNNFLKPTFYRFSQT